MNFLDNWFDLESYDKNKIIQEDSVFKLIQVQNKGYCPLYLLYKKESVIKRNWFTNKRKVKNTLTPYKWSHNKKALQKLIKKYYECLHKFETEYD